MRSEAKTNPRGIPYAPFVDRVEDYVSSRDEVEGTLKSFQEMISWVAPVRPTRRTIIAAHETPSRRISDLEPG